jgi:hypothetical protein
MSLSNVFDSTMPTNPRKKGANAQSVPTESGVFLGSDATGNATPNAVVTGTINKLPDDANTYWWLGVDFLGLLGGPSLSFYAVVTTDELDDIETTATNTNTPSKAKVSLGFREQWTQATGNLYGWGCGSSAEFEGVTVSSCYWDVNCLTKPRWT